MTLRVKIIGAGLLGSITLCLAVLSTRPELGGTRISHFDVNNGRLKVQFATFGWIYRETVEETEYSRLLKQFAFIEQPPDWRLANTVELGWRRMIYRQNVSYSYGQVASHAKFFSLWLQMQEAEPDAKREKIAEFQRLLMLARPEEVGSYVRNLPKGMRTDG